MKNILIISTIFVFLILTGCDNNNPKTISASATATRDKSGEVVVRDATKAEIDSINSFHEKIQKIEKKYPAPPTPLQKETFTVKSITEDGVFILENNVQVKMSGIKCTPEDVHFIRKFFKEDTERLTYLEERQSSNGVIEAYIWEVNSSMMNDPEMKQYDVGPFFSGINDTVILNNWCEIEPESNSKYYLRAREKITSHF
jgi:hypothetical protein